MITDTTKIKILTLSGKYISLDEWQAKYGLETGSTQIGKYFRYTEKRFQDDLAAYGQLIVCEPLMIVLDEYRRLKGTQVRISSFNRNAAKQKALREENSAVAHLRAVISEHEYFLAADIDCDNKADVLASLPILEQAAKNKNITIRIGWKDYLDEHDKEYKVWEALPEPKKPWSFPWTFLHLGVGPEYFAKGKPWNKLKHPEPWERQVRW